jgi:hypothetical protein
VRASRRLSMEGLKLRAAKSPAHNQSPPGVGSGIPEVGSGIPELRSGIPKSQVESRKSKVSPQASRFKLRRRATARWRFNRRIAPQAPPPRASTGRWNGQGATARHRSVERRSSQGTTARRRALLQRQSFTATATAAGKQAPRSAYSQ